MQSFTRILVTLKKRKALIIYSIKDKYFYPPYSIYFYNKISRAIIHVSSKYTGLRFSYGRRIDVATKHYSKGPKGIQDIIIC